MARGTFRRLAGFTLVELLVVIGIIAVLIGILMPTLAKVRQAGRRASCRSNLQQIGHFMQLYVNDYGGQMPHVETSPASPIAPGYPTMPHLLARLYLAGGTTNPAELKASMNVFRCPSDRITDPAELSVTPAGVETYFDRDGSSYAYDGFVFNAPAPPGPALIWYDAIRKASSSITWMDATHVPVFWDNESFHNWEKNSFFGGDSSSIQVPRQGAKNCLFADGHVQDMVW